MEFRESCQKLIGLRNRMQITKDDNTPAAFNRFIDARISDLEALRVAEEPAPLALEPDEIDDPAGNVEVESKPKRKKRGGRDRMERSGEDRNDSEAGEEV